MNDEHDDKSVGGGTAAPLPARGMIGVAGTWTRFIVQFATVVVIARMLGPDQYGIAAIVLVFTTLAELLRTSGAVNAVIQRSDLTPARAATIHYLCCGLASAIGAVGAAVYAAVGGRADYAVLFAVLVLSAGIGAIPGALLIREMRTGPLIGAEVAAAVASSGLALWLAHSGAGSASLVWQAAAYSVLTTLIVTFAGGFRLRAPAALGEVRAYLSFGAHTAVTQGARFVAQNSDRVLVTTTATAAEAGMYVQSGQLVMLPLAQVTGPLHRVVLPALSRLKDDDAAFRSYFRGTAAVLSLTLFPVFATLAAVAGPLIETLFGPAWAGSVPLFQILVINGCGAAFVFLSSWVFVATGRARTQSRVTLATSGLAVAGILAGSAFGPTGIAVALAATGLLTAVPVFLVARRGTGLRVRDLIEPMIPGAVIAVGVALAGMAGVAAAPGSSAAALACGLGASAIAYATGISAVPAARRRVLRFITLSRSRPDGDDIEPKENP